MNINAHLITLYRRYLEAELRAPANTVACYCRDVGQFFESLGPVPFQNVTVNDIRSFLGRRRAAGIGAATLQRQVAALRAFARFVENEGIGSALPFRAIRTPVVPRRLPRPVQTNDAVSMLRTAPANDWVGLRDQAVMLLLYGAGLRIGEALSLKAEDAPLDPERALRVWGKGSKQREVPVLPIVARFCKLYQDQCPHKLVPGTLFFRGVRGGPLSPRLIQLKMEQMRSDLGLPKTATPHALRHAFATDLLNRGADLRSLQMLLGHQSISSTTKYAEIAMDRLLTIYDAAHPRSR